MEYVKGDLVVILSSGDLQEGKKGGVGEKKVGEESRAEQFSCG